MQTKTIAMWTHWISLLAIAPLVFQVFTHPISIQISIAGMHFDVTQGLERADCRLQGSSAADIKLPPLPYDTDALEPYIDNQTMHIHYEKHHRGVSSI